MGQADNKTGLEPLILLGDEPVPGWEADDLGLDPFARVVAGAALGSPGPFTIGVFAEWGFGKTSALRIAKSLLERDRPEIVTVWFNAWQFEKEDHPIVPLIATILREIDRKQEGLGNTSRKWLSSTALALRGIAYGVSLQAEASLPLLGKVGIDIDPSKMIDREEQLHAAEQSEWEKSLYYTAFKALEEVAYPESKGKAGKPPKIVIFIDDLDRCLPPQAIKLLESIKLVLAQRGFVFVLAVSRRVVEEYLEKRFDKEYGLESEQETGARYLDKIVQLALPLPPHQSRFRKYLERLLDGRVLSDDSNRQVKEALTGLVDLLARGADYNPRSLVRLINNLIVDQFLWQRVEGACDARLLGLCAVARSLQHHLGEREYRRLVANDRLCAYLARRVGGKGEVRPEAEEGEEGRQWAELLEKDTAAQRVLGLLEAGDFLAKLLNTEPGRTWLTDREQRAKVDGFLVTQRKETEEEEEEEEETRSQREIIEDAIRRSLSLEPGTKVTDTDRVRLTELVLAGEPLTDAGLEHLADLTYLQSLHLCSWQVTDAGLAHLSGLVSLRHLSLSFTQITGEGLAHLFRLVSLQSLDLSSTKVGDAALAHVSVLSSLKELNLSSTQITDAGLARLAKLTSLEWLHLDSTQVTDGGLAHLFGLTSLRNLVLPTLWVTDAGEAALK